MDDQKALTDFISGFLGCPINYNGYLVAFNSIFHDPEHIIDHSSVKKISADIVIKNIPGGQAFTDDLKNIRSEVLYAFYIYPGGSSPQ